MYEFFDKKEDKKPAAAPAKTVNQAPPAPAKKEPGKPGRPRKDAPKK